MAFRVSINQIPKEIRNSRDIISFELEGKTHNIDLSKQNTGFGCKSYFVCPYCGDRYTYLIVTDNNKTACRNCINISPYKGIQNSTKGGYTDISYRMLRIAQKHNIPLEFPFNYVTLIFDKRLKNERFRQAVKILQALENMRFNAIIYQTIYPLKTVQSVLSGSHPNLSKYQLIDLKDFVLTW